ncbi:TrmH family RNA methyltransferase [Haploplasma axanthum]|nr:RNA methyltransferase [Haploplasma axanthum]
MIISKDNETIKYLKKLKQKKYRDAENKFLVFGDHLVSEALNNGKVLNIYTSNENKEGILITDNIMKELNFTETPYDILAVCEKVDKDFKSDKILVLEDVQDPDNVGALLRSASAFGFRTVLLSNKCADCYNEKTIRASKGAIFHLDIKRVDVYKKINELKELGYVIYTTDVRGTNKGKLLDNCVLVLGNEGQGVTDQMQGLADYKLTIKTENVESLNVAIAGSILMYEWSKI